MSGSRENVGEAGVFLNSNSRERSLFYEQWNKPFQQRFDEYGCHSLWNSGY